MLFTCLWLVVAALLGLLAAAPHLPPIAVHRAALTCAAVWTATGLAAIPYLLR